ncbi:MAG: type II secretion system GspH family protein [Defluviitaleaceae bacterium]|nr:type II secretion system GspH family protein [Defluviitaleaceae bacterium]
MWEKFKNEDGFSLLEVIISIGIMSILGIFILQIFTAGVAVNLRAGNVDIAAHTASSALEELKASVTPNSFMNTDFIVNTQVAFGLSAFFVVEERMAFSAFDFSGGFLLYKYFDENWQPISILEAYEEPSAPSGDDIAFILRLNMEPYESYYAILDIEGLFDVKIDIWDFDRGDLAGTLVNFETFVYFPIVGELYGY